MSLVRDQLHRRFVGSQDARSVLLTVLGEFVLPMDDAVWQETLVSSLEALGHKTQSARQALVRSVAGGWLARERQGRRSRVSLTPETAQILSAGAERIYSFGEDWTWDGRWLVVVLRVPEELRDVRQRIRTRLAWAGFGSLGGGLWIAPHADRANEIRVPRDKQAAVDLITFRAELADDYGDPRKLVAEAWDLEAVAVEYENFVRDFARLRPKTPEAVFRAQTLLVHAWRKFPFLDPDLPAELLPGGWPRSRAREIFRERRAAWHDPAQDYFRTLDALPAAA
jgi:phenylacetic acid degradation operon negative regulatory protein